MKIFDIYESFNNKREINDDENDGIKIILKYLHL